MEKGTSRIRARVLVMSVLPTPEGPSIRTFDFSIRVGGEGGSRGARVVEEEVGEDGGG